MVKQLLLWLLCLTSFSVFAEVTSQVSSTEIYDDETVFLTVRVSPSGDIDPRDIKALESLFTIEQTFRQQSRQIINGSSTSYTDHQFRLRPKQIGTLGIPNFRSGNEQSQPIFINVLDSTQRKDALAEDAVVLTATLSDAAPYVDEPIQLTIELAYKIQFRQPTLNDFAIDEFDITVVDEEQTTTTRNGQTYNLYRRILQLTPKSAGLYSLPDVRFSAEYANNNLGRYVRFSRHANIEAIQVQPIPENYPANAFWLPLTEFKISDNLPQQNSVPAGEHTTWQIQFSIAGQPATKLPDALKIIEGQLNDDTRLYKNPPKIEGSQRIDSAALSFLTPGQYETPEIKIPWWNVNTEQLEYATLPSRSFEVTAPIRSANSPIADSERTDSNVNSEPALGNPVTDQPTKYWRTLAIISSLGWLATLISVFAFIKRQPKPLPKQTSDLFRSPPSSANALYKHYLSLVSTVADKQAWLAQRITADEQQQLNDFERALVLDRTEPKSLKPIQAIVRKLERQVHSHKQTDPLDLYS